MLAIATWEKGASWRAQGCAGENGDRTDRAMEPRKSQFGAIWASRKSQQASLEGPSYLCLLAASAQWETSSSHPLTDRVKNYGTDNATNHAGCRHRPVRRP
jgi:hypothetical protein